MEKNNGWLILEILKLILDVPYETNGESLEDFALEIWRNHQPQPARHQTLPSHVCEAVWMRPWIFDNAAWLG